MGRMSNKRRRVFPWGSPRGGKAGPLPSPAFHSTEGSVMNGIVISRQTLTAGSAGGIL